MTSTDNKPLFSIIVPAYNAEKFINDCADSVMAQTFEDWELIIVDDGSKDDTPYLCDKLIQKDERIKVIHQPNGGEYESRKTGILESKGQYLLFLDADDMIPEDYTEKLSKYVYKADILSWQILKFHDDTKPDFVSEEADSETELYPEVSEDYSENNISLDEIIEEYTDDIDETVCTDINEILIRVISEADFSMCNKAFRRELFEHIDMTNRPRVRYSEDSLMSIGLICACKSYVDIQDVCYLYRIHSGAVSAQIRTDRLDFLMQNVTWHEQVIRSAGRWNDDVQKALYEYLLRYISDYIYTFERNGVDASDVYKKVSNYHVYAEAVQYEKIPNLGFKAWLILKLFRHGMIKK